MRQVVYKRGDIVGVRGVVEDSELDEDGDILVAFKRSDGDYTMEFVSPEELFPAPPLQADRCDYVVEEWSTTVGIGAWVPLIAYPCDKKRALDFVKSHPDGRYRISARPWPDLVYIWPETPVDTATEEGEA